MAKDKAGAAKPKDPLKKVRKLIKDIRVAMLTTVAADGVLRSRPMATPKEDFDGQLWFITRHPSPKSDDIQENQRVNVTYASPKDDRYISISGTASIVRDPAKVKEIWRRELRTWFPAGKKDPELALLRVSVDKAEYWDSAENRMVDLPRFVRVEMRGPGRRPNPVESTAPGGAQG
jgi:general stress protein 26